MGSMVMAARRVAVLVADTPSMASASAAATSRRRAKGCSLRAPGQYVQAQRQIAHSRLLRVVGRGGLGVVGQAQHRGLAGGACGQHQAAAIARAQSPDARRAAARSRAPGGLARAQHEGQLRVVVAGELVQLAGANQSCSMSGKSGVALMASAKAWAFADEFRELDLVERPVRLASCTRPGTR